MEPQGPISFTPAPSPPVTVAFAVPKGDRPEWAVQKLTEVGVDRIVLMSTHRSVVQWDGDRQQRQTARLREVARQAAMQSRRPWLPEVDGVRSFESVAREAMAAATGALCQAGGGPADLDRSCLLVGPEGGWSDEELATPLPRLGLGPTVLRSETAAVAGAVLLTALRRDGVT